MWRRLKNFFVSLKTYDDLSPDVRFRYQVSRRLDHRPELDLCEWFEAFWQPLGIEPAIAEFVYECFSKYSGLSFAKVTPSDRLEDDLCWYEVCWFDWELTLIDDFYDRFDRDLSDHFIPENLDTVEDFVRFLNDQLLTVQSM
ncbi:MAG TPA: hypothetical protein ACFE0H_06565 [Elainellaceae cyanobacterium]|jgi:hypothetical protein